MQYIMGERGTLQYSVGGRGTVQYSVGGRGTLWEGGVPCSTIYLGHTNTYTRTCFFWSLSSPVYQVEMICLALLCICIGNSAHVN